MASEAAKPATPPRTRVTTLMVRGSTRTTIGAPCAIRSRPVSPLAVIGCCGVDSLTAQGDDRIDAQGAACRYVGRRQGDEREKQRDGDERDRVEAARAVHRIER